MDFVGFLVIIASIVGTVYIVYDIRKTEAAAKKQREEYSPFETINS